MTLLDRILERGFEMPIDPIMATRIERHMRRIKPDPLFQRRLRGQVVNRYVATREGMVAVPTPPRRNLSLLGRGMLYASLLTAVSATAVGAAAQHSLPGDLLYGVKLELESIRMELAPAEMRDELAAMALDERLDEVEALAAAGRWAEVDEAVAAVERAQATLAALISPSAGNAGLGVAMPDHIDRLTALISTAPDAEKRGLMRALAASGGTPSEIHSNRDHATGNREQRRGQRVAPVAPSTTPAPTQPPATPTPAPTSTPTPTPIPTAEPEDEGDGQEGDGQRGGGSAPRGPGASNGNPRGSAPSE